MSIRHMLRTRVIAGASVLALAGGVAAAAPAGAATAGGASGRAHAVRPTVDSFQIVNFNSDLCLGISGGRSHAPAVQWKCNGNPDQQWHFGSPIGSGSAFYQLINADGQCLGVAGGSPAAGTAVVAWTCLGPSHQDQYWEVDATGPLPGCPGWEELDNASSLDEAGVSGNSTASGASVVQWPDQGVCNNEFWTGPPPTAG